jgi:uncharacterized protein (DUF983 family)
MDCQECGKEVNIERTKDLAAFFLRWLGTRNRKNISFVC